MLNGCSRYLALRLVKQVVRGHLILVSLLTAHKFITYLYFSEKVTDQIFFGLLQYSLSLTNLLYKLSGYGLFTDKELIIGEYICQYRGEKISADEAEKRKHFDFIFYFRHDGEMLLQ